MREKILYGCWAGLYILCVGLGTIEEPAGLGKAVMVLLSVLFFLPGAMLLHDGQRAGDRKAVRRIRWIALGSLVLTLALLVANFCAVHASEAVGQALYDILLLVSAPMICSQYWMLSMFLWACLLFASLKKLPKAKE